jgi:hypothetical protein
MVILLTVLKAVQAASPFEAVTKAPLTTSELGALIFQTQPCSARAEFPSDGIAMHLL